MFNIPITYGTLQVPHADRFNPAETKVSHVLFVGHVWVSATRCTVNSSRHALEGVSIVSFVLQIQGVFARVGHLLCWIHDAWNQLTCGKACDSTCSYLSHLCSEHIQTYSSHALKIVSYLRLRKLQGHPKIVGVLAAFSSHHIVTAFLPANGNAYSGKNYPAPSLSHEHLIPHAPAQFINI